MLFRSGVAIVTSGTSRVELRAGRIRLAEQMLIDARQQFDKLGARPYLLDTISRQAECMIVDRQPHEALELLAEISTEADDVPPPLLSFCDRMWACALSQLGQIGAAIGHICSAVERSSERLPYEAAASVWTGRRIAAEADIDDPFPHFDVDELANSLGVVSFPELPVSALRT